jgi:hypothetical protein
MTPEQQARASIDALLVASGWHVCNVANANIHAATGVAIREFPLNSGFGFADYLLYVNGKACGVIEAKKEGTTLTGVELQSGRYAQGRPTGVETHFTNGLYPKPRARAVFAFFRPELLVQWLAYLPTPVRPELVEGVASTSSARTVQEPNAPGTFLARMQHMLTLVTEWGNLQSSLGQSQLEDCKTQTAQANLFQGKIRQLVFASPPLAQQAESVAEVDRHLSIIREVDAVVDANLQRVQASRQATLARVFSKGC